MRVTTGALLALAVFLSSCATTPKDTLPTVAKVDLPRFMGKWYVIASIPTAFEKNAYNAIESYKLNSDGTIAALFTYHKGAFDGKLKSMKPKGFVSDESNAVWGMRIFWPFKSEYRIAYLNDAYSETIIARSARDHVWIMARQPALSVKDYEQLIAKVGALGYDTSKVQLVPQHWPQPYER